MVTGSSKGLGKAMALGLGRAGAKVAMNYCHGREAAAAAFDELLTQGSQGMLVQADITAEDDVERACREVAATLGPVDILVCNASCHHPMQPIESYDWAFYAKLLDYFVKSPFLLSRACLPHMKQQKWGRIITITSEVVQLGTAPFTAYVAAKGGQVGFARSLAREVAEHGITVNMIAPGWIPVERHANDPQAAKDAYLAEVPAQRWGTPADIAAAVVYYASHEAGFVTGQTLSVNGGHTVS